MKINIFWFVQKKYCFTPLKTNLVFKSHILILRLVLHFKLTQIRILFIEISFHHSCKTNNKFLCYIRKKFCFLFLNFTFTTTQCGCQDRQKYRQNTINCLCLALKVSLIHRNKQFSYTYFYCFITNTIINKCGASSFSSLFILDVTT